MLFRLNCNKYLVFATAVALTVSMIIYQMIQTTNEDELHYVEGTPVVLWWTPFGTDRQLRKCGKHKCYFTKDREFQHHRDLRSILFYGTSFAVDDLPKWKSDRVRWGLLHEESPRNNPILVHRQALNLFHYSSTFSRFSDVPLTLLDLPEITKLVGKKFFVPTKLKTELMRKNNLAPLLYIQSDCDTASNRDSYVMELMKHIRVDSYGACLNNAKLEKRFKDNYLDNLDSDEFLTFVASYKFTIAFENAVCQDYITEKLWRPLIVGSVPVYYGSPSFKDWLPNNMSAISILDYKNPKALANFLHDLLTNDTKYEEYLPHKLLNNFKVKNDKLNEALEERRKSGRNKFANYLEDFECFVCERVENENKNKKLKTPVDVKQYDCPLPRNPITNEEDQSNWWLKQWIFEKCGAKLLAHYLKNNLTIDNESFGKAKIELLNRNDCETS